MHNIQRLESLEEKDLQQLTNLLMDSVTGGASVGFMNSLTRKEARNYWKSLEHELRSELILLTAQKGEMIAGSVQVALCSKANGKHRAEIRKLLVDSSYRGQGIASRLMHDAESQAHRHGCSLLVLDTHEGSTAEAIYEHLGWNRAGVIPDYAASPEGQLHDTVLFYKKI